jgi:O-antigen ligase
VLAFEPLKASILRVGAVVLGVAWLVGPRRISLTPVTLTGLLLVTTALVSTALSVEPAVSFFGTFGRGTGWLTLAACGVLLVVSADVCGDATVRERVLAALALGALVPSAYAIAQRLGLDPVAWTALGAPGSSLASPTFLGGYLVLIAPLALYKTLRAAQCGSRVRYAGWLALTLVICGETLPTTIRGPILGLFVGLATFAVVARLRVRLVVLGGGIALAVALVVAGGAATVGLQRFGNIARLGDSSIERLTVWNDSLGLPLAAPVRSIVGFGPDTQQVSLERAEATMRLTQNQQWDRAHNVLLDAWLTGGALGLMALLAFGVSLANGLRVSGGGMLRAALAGALLGHLAEVTFAFETVTSSAIVWLVAGIVGSLDAGRRIEAGGWPFAFAGLLLGPLVATPAIADALYGAGGAVREEAAANLAPWVEELPRAAGLDWLKAGDRDRAAANLRLAAARAPEEPLPWLRLARFYFNANDLAEAEASCQQAIRTGPFRAAVWDGCADVAGRAGLIDLAAQRRARADALRH